MGQVGRFLGESVGGYAGGRVGKLVGHYIDKLVSGRYGYHYRPNYGYHEYHGEKQGRKHGTELIGELGERFIPFKKGGVIKKTGKVLLHKGEYLLDSKPTKKQKKAVAKRHKKK